MPVYGNFTKVQSISSVISEMENFQKVLNSFQILKENNIILEADEQQRKTFLQKIKEWFHKIVEAVKSFFAGAEKGFYQDSKTPIEEIEIFNSSYYIDKIMNAFCDPFDDGYSLFALVLYKAALMYTEVGGLDDQDKEDYQNYIDECNRRFEQLKEELKNPETVTIKDTTVGIAYKKTLETKAEFQKDLDKTKPEVEQLERMISSKSEDVPTVYLTNALHVLTQYASLLKNVMDLIQRDLSKIKSFEHKKLKGSEENK